MEIKPIVCPNCGAKIEIGSEAKQCFCSFCGSQMIIDDGTRTVRIIDEAKLKEVDLKRDKFEYKKEQENNQKEIRKKRIKRWRISVIVSLTTLFLFSIISNFWSPIDYDSLIFIILLLAFLLPAILSTFRPDKSYEDDSPPIPRQKTALFLLLWGIAFSSWFITCIFIYNT